MKKLLLVFAVFVLMAGCKFNENYVDDEENTYLLPQEDEPAMVIYNDSIFTMRIAYVLPDSDGQITEVEIPAGSEAEIETGVEEITITGGSF